MNNKLTKAQIRQLKQPTKDYLCSPEDNIYGIQFVYFKIRNALNNQNLFEIRKPESEVGKKVQAPTRFVQYHFGPLFFRLKTIGTTL